MFFPLVTFRRESALVLVNRPVETAFGPHRKFVAMTIAAHPHHEGVEAREVFFGGQRAHRGEATVVLQRYHAAEHRAVGENLKSARGDAAHHVVVDDLPRGRIGGGREVENDFVGSRVSIHGEGKASQHDGSGLLERNGWSGGHFHFEQVRN